MTVSPQNELSYLGVNATNPPNVFPATRAPTAQDSSSNFRIGDIWVDTVGMTSYVLVNISGVVATWDQTGAGVGVLAHLTASTGGALNPTAGNINIFGTANQITTAGAASTITLTLPVSVITPGSLTTTTSLTATLGNITATNGNLVLGTAGNKLSIATGANASIGTATLAGTPGTVTVATSAVTASSIILISRNTPGGTLGNLSVPTASISAGVHFVINSDANETSTINWMIIN